MIGCTLRELRERMHVGELPLWAAYAEQHGPWWSERGDYHAAALARAFLAAMGGKPGPLGDYLIQWGGASAAPKNLLPYDAGIAALAAMAARW